MPTPLNNLFPDTRYIWYCYPEVTTTLYDTWSIDAMMHRCLAWSPEKLITTVRPLQQYLFMFLLCMYHVYTTSYDIVSYVYYCWCCFYLLYLTHKTFTVPYLRLIGTSCVLYCTYYIYLKYLCICRRMYVCLYVYVVAEIRLARWKPRCTAVGTRL